MGKVPNKNLSGSQCHKHLYHYTSFKAFKQIWASNRLNFGEVHNVNDLLEWNFPARTRNWQQTNFLEAFYRIRNSYKQISLTMDYDSVTKGCMSPMMWGIYADKSKGVCLEFDYDRIPIPHGALQGSIHYQQTMERGIELDPMISSDEELIDFIILHKRQIMFTKHISWAGENEYRILSNEMESINNIKDAITSIYLTSFEKLEEVEILVGDNIPIMYFGYKKDDKSNRAIPFVHDIFDYKKLIDANIIPVITITDPLLKAKFFLK